MEVKPSFEKQTPKGLLPSHWPGTPDLIRGALPISLFNSLGFCLRSLNPSGSLPKFASYSLINLLVRSLLLKEIILKTIGLNSPEVLSHSDTGIQHSSLSWGAPMD